MSRKRYTFLKDDKNRNSRRSLALSGISALIFLILLMAGYASDGKTGPAYGAFGLMAAVFSVIAFALAVEALSAGTDRRQTAVISTIISGVLMIGWAGIFLLGIH